MVTSVLTSHYFKISKSKKSKQIEIATNPLQNSKLKSNNIKVSHNIIDEQTIAAYRQNISSISSKTNEMILSITVVIIILIIVIILTNYIHVFIKCVVI